MSTFNKKRCVLSLIGKYLLSTYYVQVLHVAWFSGCWKRGGRAEWRAALGELGEPELMMSYLDSQQIFKISGPWSSRFYDVIYTEYFIISWVLDIISKKHPLSIRREIKRKKKTLLSALTAFFIMPKIKQESLLRIFLLESEFKSVAQKQITKCPLLRCLVSFKKSDQYLFAWRQLAGLETILKSTSAPRVLFLW